MLESLHRQGWSRVSFIFLGFSVTFGLQFKLIGNVLEKGIFDVGIKHGSVRLLSQSLGVRFEDNKLSFANSNRHAIPVALGNVPFPKVMEDFVSTGFVRQNHSVLEMWTTQNSDNGSKYQKERAPI